MIKISVPNDDHVALRAMAKALEEIAVARGAPLQVNLVTEEMLEKLKETRGGNIVCEPEVDTISQQVESLCKETNHVSYTPPTTDSTGTPWDERIHSASKALNADGTWRLRRKPKDMDEGEWLAYVETVRDELSFPADREQAVQLGNPEDPEAPLAEEWDGVGENVPEPPRITPEGDDFHTDTGVVTEQQVASFPPPPPVPVPPAPVAQETTAPDGHGHAHMTFPQVMAFLTERHGRITSAQVDQIIADMGLEKITDLNTQPEHTGPFIARVKALLGE